jgi:ATP-dependent Clp protease ATP-binding subunit ClpA
MIPHIFGPQFSGNARTTVRSAVAISREFRADRVEGTHLLLALAQSGGTAARALATCGVDADGLRAAMRRSDEHRSDHAGLSESDVSALAQFGIDADAILEALGDPAAGRLDRSTTSGGSKFRGLSSAARAALIATAATARDAGAKSITESDILVAVIDADPECRRILALWDVTRADVVTALAEQD